MYLGVVQFLDLSVRLACRVNARRAHVCFCVVLSVCHAEMYQSGELTELLEREMNS